MVQTFNKILVIQTAFIGDVILATAVLEKLHIYYPNAKIDVCIRQGNENLFEHHPFVNQIFIWKKKEQKYRNLVILAKQFRSRQYDIVINLQRFFSSGFLTAFSGGNFLVGYNKNPWSRFFHFKHEHKIGTLTDSIYLHETERNQVLIERFTDAEPAKPKLYINAGHIEKVQKFLSEGFITIAPASVWFTKQYPIEKWVAFLDLLPEKLQVFILGASADNLLAEKIIYSTKHKKITSLCGELKLLETAALMPYAIMNYTNDSAPMHIASAMNAPVTAIYCSTITAFGFGPLSSKSFIVEKQEPLYCRPCGLHGYSKCPEKHFRCALEIDSQQLLKSLKS